MYALEFSLINVSGSLKRVTKIFNLVKIMQAGINNKKYHVSRVKYKLTAHFKQKFFISVFWEYSLILIKEFSKSIIQ